ncbi:MAG: 50S ribosomal protein L25 [Acidobacteria bacterium]|jgi:large subunit ribosomal protein L25|nr:50S ribosomal protein L25 [Acidobacteriota bacterium]MBP8274567.1 50S ribosomal protein L25 [Acidobacteriota bacterium]
MELTLEAVKRNTFGRNEAGRLRRAGQIPAVVYGGGGEGVALAVDPKSLLRILHSKSGVNTLISLKYEGAGDMRVLVKEYQLEPVGHRLLHADFYKVAMDKAIRVTVPVHLEGESKGVKVQGGVVDFVNREVEIECLPADIPEHISVDITELMLNQGIRVRDLAALSNKWTAVTEGDLLLVHIVMPKVEAAATPADGAAAAPAEPEVAKKGKVDKDDDKKDEKKK